MKNILSKYGAVIAAVLFVGAIFAGNSKWFKKLFTSSEAGIPKDGDPCTTSSTPPIPGKYKNGVCVAESGHSGNTSGNGSSPKADATNQRTSNIGTNAPAKIQVWVGAPVPYKYMGCSYGNPYFTVFQGQRVMVLSKISCP